MGRPARAGRARRRRRVRRNAARSPRSALLRRRRRGRSPLPAGRRRDGLDRVGSPLVPGPRRATRSRDGSRPEPPRASRDRARRGAAPLVWAERPEAQFVTIGQAAWNAALDRGPRDLRWIDRGVVTEEEKAEAFARATIFAMPSEHETFGHTYLEAWSAGLPVIAGDIAPLREIVREGVDGLHVRNERRAIASAILALLRDPDRARRMGAAGRERVEHEFSWPMVAKRTEAAYIQARTRSRAAARE